MPDDRKNAVVICVDLAFAPFALFVAWQVHTLCPGRSFDLVLASFDEIVVPPALADCGILIERMPPNEIIERLPRRRLPSVSFQRLFLPQVFADRYRRLLYLDADLFFDGGDLDRLLDSDLGGRPVAAVRSQRQHLNQQHLVDEFRITGLGPRPYFNTGVILFDVDAYVSGSCVDRMLAASEKYPDLGLIMQDQALFNVALVGEIAELNPVWNWQHNGELALLGYGMPVRFHHFIGNLKPWHGKGGPHLRRFQMVYQDFFDRVLPEATHRVARGPAPRVPPLRPLLHLFGRYFKTRKPFGAFLNRFRDEWHVIQ